MKDIQRTVERSDLVYYADVSGIRKSDLSDLKAGEIDKLEYGGLNNTDYTFIREFIKTKKPMIIESSFFGPADPLVRYNLEQMMDVYYVGWVGKYMKDLADDADLFAGLHWKELYKEYTGNVWDASGPGFVMINPEARRVLVLSEGVHVQTGQGLIVTTDQAMETYGLPSLTNFEGWFTVLHPGRNAVLSEFRLDPTDAGMQLLNDFGIPETFPALIHVDENVWMMAGDFGKCKTNVLFPKVIGVGTLYERIMGSGKGASSFFYSYYQPFMTHMIDEAREVREQNN